MATGMMVRQYHDVKAYEKDAKKLGKDGWSVANVANAPDEDKGGGFLGGAFRAGRRAGGVKKKQALLVTYHRAR